MASSPKIVHAWHITDGVSLGVPGVLATCSGCSWVGPFRPVHHLMRAGLDGGRHVIDARLDAELAGELAAAIAVVTAAGGRQDARQGSAA